MGSKKKLEIVIVIVKLFEIYLKESWFSEYEVDKQYSLGINCELVFKILNCLDENQNIKLEYSDDDHLYITLYPRDGEQSITKEFQLPLVMMDNDILAIPDTDYSVDLKMVSSEFSKIAHLGSSSITIKGLVCCYNSPEENSARVADRGGSIIPAIVSQILLLYQKITSNCWLGPDKHYRLP